MKLIEGKRVTNGTIKNVWGKEVEKDLKDLAIEETRHFKSTGVTFYYCETVRGKLRFKREDGSEVYEVIQTIYKTIA